MNIEQARILVGRLARAWEQADVETVVADFAPDGVLISPGGRWQGHTAIRAAMQSFYEYNGSRRLLQIRTPAPPALSLYSKQTLMFHLSGRKASRKGVKYR